MPRVKTIADLTYEDLGVAPPATGDGLLPALARTAREAVCDLYENFPGGMLRQLSNVEKAVTGQQALLDTMCRPIGKLPPPPSTPFTGGQCGHEQYEMEFTTQETAVYNDGFRQENVLRRYVVNAPVRGIRLAGTRILNYQGTYLKTFSTLIIDHAVQQPNGNWLDTSVTYQFFADGDNRGFNAVGGTTARRLNGQPDNCGDPKPKYPVVYPPVDKVTKNTNVTVNNNVVIPVALNIIPTVIAPVTNIITRPEINVDVGGINVNFGLDGITFGDNDGIPPGSDIPFDPRIDPPDSIDLGDTITTPAVDLSPVITKLNELQKEIEECCDRYYPYQNIPANRIVQTELGQGNSGSFQVPDRCFLVRVQVLGDLDGASQQAGNAAPTVYHIGWGWFDSGLGMSDRLPVDAREKSFTPPARAISRFCFTMQKTYTAKVIAYSVTAPPT